MKQSTADIIDMYKKYVMTSCVKKLEPIVLVSGRGATVKDIEGKEYIDCWSGISVVNAGHCNPQVIDAAINQAKQLIHVCSYVYHAVPPAQLAAKLAEIMPAGLQKTFFGNSGAEAVECAMKIARKFTKKHEMIALMCSFHGRTLGSLTLTGQASRKRYSMGPYLSGIAFAPAPYCYRCFLGQEYPECGIQCAKMIEDVINYSTSNCVAAFIAEPILGEGGIIVPPKEYFREAKKILDKYGILFIDDEVQTGFARTGKMFGIDHYGVNPDIVTTAKGIADGFPLGACTAKENIGDAFEAGDHLSTFGGNPVSCAAAIANIDYILKENLPKQATNRGNYMIKRLEEIKERSKFIGEVRGKGLLIGVELVKDRETKTPASEEAVKVRDHCRERGVLVGHGGVKGNVIRIQPPLVMNKQQMEKALQTLDEALKQLK
jgi:4-aminobutyrate aminotransferase/(S)-3-amino-2-methylpropionate transaminase